MIGFSSTPDPPETLSGVEPVNRIAWAPQPGSLPMRQVTRGSRAGAAVATGLGGLWCVWMGASFVEAVSGQALPGTLAMLALFTSPGVAVLVFGIGQFLYRHEIIVDRDGVTVTRASLWGWRGWHEPVSAYRGVRGRVHLDMPDDASARIGSRYEFTLALAHADRRREILLYEASSRFPAPPEAWTRQWQQYSELLRLPKLDEPAA